MVFAYLDPGAGSLLIQAVLAGMLAIPFFLRSHIGNLVRRVRRDRHGDEDVTGRG